MITEEQLMAFVDGELPSEVRHFIEAEAAQNPQLRSAIARERRLRSSLSNLHSSAIEEEAPERLTRMLRPQHDKVNALKPRAAVRSANYWPMITAIAASLALVAFLGPMPGSGRVAEEGEAISKIDNQLATALQTQLASEQGTEDPVQIGISFIGPEREVCRTFEIANRAGLACRSDNQWQVRLVAFENGSEDTEYRRASTASVLIMGSAQEMIRGEPMSAVEERQARDGGWRATVD